MCVPSATLTVWSTAWLHGRAASDDVLDALHLWTERQELAAADEAAAEAVGLPARRSEPLVTLLPMLRRFGDTVTPSLALPAPGDVRGLDGGGPFTTAALAAGEAVVLPEPGIGLVPNRIDGALRWTVHELAAEPAQEYLGIADAEEHLTTTVRESAQTLAELQVANERPDAHDDLRARLRTRPHLSWPSDMPGRSLRVLQRADEVDAILALAADDDPGGAVSAGAAARRTEALRPLVTAVRTARVTAIAEAVRSIRERTARR